MVVGIDLREETRAFNEELRALIATRPPLETVPADVPEHGAEERRDSDISPLYADLHGLPSALFTVGTADPLLDDSLFMAARWSAAGNDADLRVYEDGVHGFNAFPIGIGLAANLAQLEFLKSRWLMPRRGASGDGSGQAVWT